MSFSFGFGGDDIDGDDANVLGKNDQRSGTTDSQPAISPKAWSLQELLPLLPSQLTYNTISIVSGSRTIGIPRRSLFDIRAQLMAEANPDENENDRLLTRLDAGDLNSGQYEGGFKTWECAIDLAEEISAFDLEGSWHVIELGAGSALPSLTLLQKTLKRALQTALRDSSPTQQVRFTFCDYNEDVLKLCTMPNVILNYLLTTTKNVDDAEQVIDSDDHDIDLDDASSALFQDTERILGKGGISVQFVCGSWGPDFVNLLQTNSADASKQNTLILASETIYSPAAIKVFTSTIMELLKYAKGSARALVAAKKIYFGVGGGTDEFMRCVHEAGGISKVIREDLGSGTARVVLEATRPP